MYTEDQFGIKIETKEDKEKQKKLKKKLTIIGIILLVVILLTIILVIVFKYLNEQKEAQLPVVRLSVTEWTKDPITLVVDNQEVKLVSYSFDGGKTWQNENAIQVDDNGTYIVMVKNEKGKVSKATNVVVSNIDKDGPIINLTDPLYVQRGGTYNDKTSLSVTDSGSGVKEYTSEPSNIDTNSDGEYTVVYTAVDHVGNVTQKSRKVIVRNLITTTYYRSRSISQERYSCTKPCASGTCKDTCKRDVYGEWSEWTTTKIKPTNKLQVETKIE